MTTERFAWVHLQLGEPVELDDLCVECHHATLVAFPIVELSASGVTPDMGTITTCYHCVEAVDE